MDQWFEFSRANIFSLSDTLDARFLRERQLEIVSRIVHIILLRLCLKYKDHGVDKIPCPFIGGLLTTNNDGLLNNWWKKLNFEALAFLKEAIFLKKSWMENITFYVI